MTVPRSLAERRLSVLQFQADLRALVKAWGTPGKLGAEIGFSAVSISNQMKGYQPATGPMCEKLYGPGHGNRLIVRGPDCRPVERRWVGDREPEPVAVADVDPGLEAEAGEDEQDPDDVDAGCARIAAIVGRRPETEQVPQLPSTLQPSAEKAPAVETAEAAGPNAAGLEPESAAGDGAADSPEIEIPAGPDVAAAEDVTEEPDGDAVTAGGEAKAPEPEDRRPPATTAPVPGGAVTHSDAAPWSRLEDRDLVAILRGKAAGLKAEVAELEAEAEALEQRARVLRGQANHAERRRGQLLVTIDHFETEEGSAAPGIRGQQEIADGDEGEAA